ESPLQKRLGSEFFERLPSTPGVYFMLGRSGELLYIGKAKSLRARLLSYRRARRGQVPERTLALLAYVHEIRIELHRSGRLARLRESELLHAVRPPFNIADTEEAHYLFIGLRDLGGREPGSVEIEFWLTSGEDTPPDPPLELFGCFRHRPKTKLAYTA